jgi:hypothetical protein
VIPETSEMEKIHPTIRRCQKAFGKVLEKSLIKLQLNRNEIMKIMG